MADELRLVLYALHQQATVGPCAEPKPWGWNVVESAKWESWSQLGNMSSMEAMRLYVKMVEDEQVGLRLGAAQADGLPHPWLPTVVVGTGTTAQDARQPQQGMQ